ncbi:MAG TPA: flagellar hook-length control protein FliK [Methylophaga aminisulfidivorans]|uniref:Flagellar hook-length control protein FliK n=1 Tax=Methylophaga aminisulfidivorans TaxID=230105 RepID=A0A7C1W5H1_9GAMM|nr:flagellar hook-length control protein FliK [Methylophaga aminisulfidivorans]
MPQTVSIQLDAITSPKVTRSNISASKATGESFSNAMEGQVKADKHSPAKTSEKVDSSAEKESVSDEKQIASKESSTTENTESADTSEKTDGEDGNKLPGKAEGQEQGGQAEAIGSAQTSNAATPIVSHVPQAPSTTNDEASLNGADIKFTKASDPLSTQTKNTSVDPNLISSSAEQKASKAAKTSQSATITPNSAKEQQSQLTLTEQKSSLVTLSENEKAAIKTLQRDDLKPTPNFAETLKSASTNKEDVDGIRADLLDAIRRQRQGNTEDGQVATARKVLGDQQAAQSENKLNLPQLDKSPGERPSTTFTNVSSTLASQTQGAQTSSSSTTVSLPIQPTIQSSAWSQVMNSRVVWMAKEGIQQAELKMTPANLGPVEVKLHMQNDQATVSFTAQHAATRDALEQALPRLRESFAENGIQLNHAEVGQQHQEQSGQQSEQTESSRYFSKADAEEDAIVSEAEISEQSVQENNGLSLYA